MDIDSKGVMWSALASGHLGELRPQQVQGPAERPDSRPASIARKAGRSIRARDRSSAASTDAGSGETQLLHLGRPAQHLGLGNDVPIATGNQNDSLIALVDGKFVKLRVPYPMGF